MIYNPAEIKNLKNFLEGRVNLYNNKHFIETDPIQIPHLFTKSEDIEIAGFLVASIAWGQRKTIINNGKLLMYLMGNEPYNFIMNASENDMKPIINFKHRTFNGDDCHYFISSLQNIYKKYGGMKPLFLKFYNKNQSVKEAIIQFRKVFFETEYPSRTLKHFSDITKNAAAKRINMFLRWLVRKDNNSVDFGIWNEISTKHLFIPLDLHTGNTARKLGLLQRKQNDWIAVEELTNTLKEFNETDPVKYDYALFGLGVFEKY